MFKFEAAKKAVRTAMVGTALLGVMVAPVAQAAPAKATQNVTVLRAGAATDKDSQVKGSGAIVAVLALIAIIGGVLAATSGSSKPTSP